VLNEGRIPFFEPGLDELIAKSSRSGHLKFTVDLTEALLGSEFTFIAVGTPSRDGAIDLEAIRNATRDAGLALRMREDYHVVVVKSTVIPGTTDGVVLPELEQASGRSDGTLEICMNPEFLREGSAVKDVMNPDRIVIGANSSRAAEAVAELYREFGCPILRTNTRNAEMIKYASNTLLATMISFSNEIAALCEGFPGLDEAVVMEGLHLDRRMTPVGKDSSFAPGILSYLRAGIGFGGSCLPKDLDALRHFASGSGVSTPVLDAAAEVNRMRPTRVVQLLETSLGGIAGKTIAVLGMAFKPGTDDVRDSPSLPLVRSLLDAGARVRVHDPLALEATAALLDDTVEYCHAVEAATSGAHAAIVATAWQVYLQADWYELCEKMQTPVILDGRGLLNQVDLPEGVRFLRIGVSAG